MWKVVWIFLCSLLFVPHYLFRRSGSTLVLFQTGSWLIQSVLRPEYPLHVTRMVAAVHNSPPLAKPATTKRDSTGTATLGGRHRQDYSFADHTVLTITSTPWQEEQVSSSWDCSQDDRVVNTDLCPNRWRSLLDRSMDKPVRYPIMSRWPFCLVSFLLRSFSQEGTSRFKSLEEGHL